VRGHAIKAWHLRALVVIYSKMLHLGTMAAKNRRF
jgi:hypothetical protein